MVIERRRRGRNLQDLGTPAKLTGIFYGITDDDIFSRIFK